MNQKTLLRIGRAGNDTPVFLTAEPRPGLDRPFGAVWDQGRSVWMYPAFLPVADRVLTDFEAIGGYQLTDAAIEHMRILGEFEAARSAGRLPDGFSFKTKPFEHQIEALCQAFYFMRSALFLAPGLGKSKVIVDLARLLRHLGDRRQLMVLGPRVTARNWEREFSIHADSGEFKVVVVVGDPKERAAALAQAPKADVVVTTYDVVRMANSGAGAEATLAQLPFATIVADESHTIKSWRGQRTQAARALASRASRRIIMTGTPTLGDPRDLYGQFKFLGEPFMPEQFHRFEEKYLEKSPRNEHVVVGYKNLDVLSSRVDFISLRKTKEQCLDLPERTIVDVFYRLRGAQATTYDVLVDALNLEESLAALEIEAAGGTIPIPPNAGVRLIKLLQVCSGFLTVNPPNLCDMPKPEGCLHKVACVLTGIKPYTAACHITQIRPPDVTRPLGPNPKLTALMELLDSILEDATNKVIIWCVFRQELRDVEEALRKRGWGYVRADGESKGDPQDLVDAFNKKPEVRVYLGQVAKGVGITLNAAAYMVYYAVTFSLGSYLQSIDRNYRIGQQKNVTVYRLIGEGTIEPSIYALLDRKIDVDTVLTRRTPCLFCDKQLYCIALDVNPFDPDCLYKANMPRPVTRPGKLPKYDGEEEGLDVHESLI